MTYPFIQKELADRLIREFSKDVNSSELVWHRDRYDRDIKIVTGKGWQLQIENSLPQTLEAGKTYHIPAETYHRVIKGTTKLVVEIKESKMKITKGELQKLIREYEQYVDEDGNVWDDEGNVTRKGAAFGRQYGGGTYGTNAPWQGGRSRSRYSSRRKTTHVGASANAEKIAAVEKALEAKPNNFLTSVLSQLKAGRGLSSKQNAIVKKILAKSNKEAAALFESRLRRLIREKLLAAK